MRNEPNTMREDNGHHIDSEADTLHHCHDGNEALLGEACEARTAILFTRVPIPHKTKTRLMTLLTAQQCADLQRAMVFDTARMLSQSCDSLVLCYSDEWQGEADGSAVRDAFIEDVRACCTPSCSFTALPQIGEGLGARMDHAISHVLQNGAHSCLLMGSDLPYVTTTHISQAYSILSSNDVVLGPAADGGYWVVGMTQPFPELFQEKAYGSGNVLDDALSTCSEHSRKVGLCAETHDIDTVDDFWELTRNDHLAGSSTRETVRSILGSLS